MPVVSRAQAGFVAMSKTAQGRAKLRAHGKRPMPVKVATEFQTASRGLSVKSLPMRKKRPAHEAGIHTATRRSRL